MQHESGQGRLGLAGGRDEFSDGRDHGDDELGAWFGRSIEDLPGLRLPLGVWITVRHKPVKRGETYLGDQFEMV